jgi:PIN domain nuclease of toxin-antitoxin system
VRENAASVPDVLVLDTHVWFWFVVGHGVRLGRRVPKLIERAGNEGRAFVSAISAWELAMLADRGRVRLATDVGELINVSREPPGIRIVDVTPEIAVDGGRLPGFPHGDPADRIIVATARALAATMLTCDDRILSYGAAGNLKVLDAGA